MMNSFTNLIRAAVGAKSRSTCLNANECSQAPMTQLSFDMLKQVRGGDGVIESPKGSWGPMTSSSAN